MEECDTMSLYLDYNATTPIHPNVLKEMINIYSNYYGNADSRTHNDGINARKVVEEARTAVSNILGVDNNEVIFTSGATESNNMAILGLYDYGVKHNKKHIITTAIEHKAVLEPCKILEKRGFKVDFIEPDSSGAVKYEDILEKVREDTLLVSVMHVNNETGIIQPVLELGSELDRRNVYFHIDAAQSCGKLVSELKDLKYDMLSVTGHKMYGPQGIGALILKRKGGRRAPIEPICYGGQQEDGLRPGTSPVALIGGFGKACEIARKNYKKNNKVASKIQSKIINMLETANIEFYINGDLNKCIANTLNISFVGIDSEALMLYSKEYCSISNGSACTSKNYNHSHVLETMKLPKERLESAIRISWGYEDVDYKMIDEMITIIKNCII